jgi:hypothetical protein
MKTIQMKTVLAALLLVLFTGFSSFTAKKEMATKAAAAKYNLSVTAGFGPGPVHINVFVSGADPDLPVYFTLSYNDGARIESYSVPAGGSDYTTVVQSPVVAAFVDVVDFYQ